MNRKALSPQLILIVVGLVALAIIIAMLAFSGTARFVVVGAGMIFGAIYVFVKGGRSQKTAVFALVLLAVGAGFIISSGFVQQTVFSVSDITYIEGQQIVRIVASPGEENAIVSLTADDINQRLEGKGWSVDKGVRIELTSEEYTKRFSLVKDENAQLYILGRTDIGNAKSSKKADIIQQCKTTYPTTVDAYLFDEGGLSIANAVCIYKMPNGNLGYISNTISDDVKIRVTAAGDSQVIQSGTQFVTLADGNIRVKFEGSLQPLDRIEGTGQLRVWWQNGKFQYLVAPDSLSKQSEVLSEYYSRTSGLNIYDGTNYNAAILAHNNRIRDVVLKNANADYSPTLVKSINLATESSDTNKGRLSITMRRGAAIPLLTIDVKGSFLGIERLQGKPDITSCVSDISAKAGRESELRGILKVKNVGAQEGRFSIGITCTNAKTDAFVDSTVTLAAGEEESLTVQVAGSSSTPGATERGKCTVTVTDRQGGGSDSCTFGTAIEFSQNICFSGQSQCSADKRSVLACSSEGDSLDVAKECASDEECGYSDGKVACVKKSLLPDIDDLLSDGGTSTGGSGSSADEVRADCEAKAAANPFAGYTLVTRTSEPTGFQRAVTIMTLGIVGDLAPETTVSCEAKFIPYYIFGGIFIVLGIGIVILTKTPARKGRKKRR